MEQAERRVDPAANISKAENAANKPRANQERVEKYMVDHTTPRGPQKLRVKLRKREIAR